MNHNSKAICQNILEESADWLMCLNEGELTPQQQQDFMHWQHASPEHIRAWGKTQRLLDNFEHLPSYSLMPSLSATITLATTDTAITA